jgi:MFS family permease
MPSFTERTGPTGVAALATVAFLLPGVAGELLTSPLLTRIGYRSVLALGLTLLGAPTIVLTLFAGTWVIVAVSLVRGCGFAIWAVTGGALTATLIPPSDGEGFALVGLVGGLAGMLALPAGVWAAAARWGYTPVFVIATMLTLLTALSVPGLSRQAVSAERSCHHGVLAGPRDSAPTRTGPHVLPSAALQPRHRQRHLERHLRLRHGRRRPRRRTSRHPARLPRPSS